MTLDNYISEAISTGKHKKKYTSTTLSVDSKYDDWIEALVSAGYTESDELTGYLDCPKDETFCTNNSVALKGIKFTISNRSYWIVFDRYNSTLAGMYYMGKKETWNLVGSLDTSTGMSYIRKSIDRLNSELSML